jgi:uncharacterized protein (UPF0216 family)
MILFKSNDPLERAIGAVLTREIQKLNTHLPKRREPMTELLKRADPTVEAVDGSSILLRTAELQQLARIVPFEYQDRVRLPMIVLRRPQVVELIQKYHSLFVIGFGVPKELSDYAPNRD